MNVLRGIGREIVGLFVDDWPTSVALVAWLVLAAKAVPSMPSAVQGPALFAGIALILLVSVGVAVRRARGARASRRTP
jgi:hypothetical protein